MALFSSPCVTWMRITGQQALVSFQMAWQALVRHFSIQLRSLLQLASIVFFFFLLPSLLFSSCSTQLSTDCSDICWRFKLFLRLSWLRCNSHYGRRMFTPYPNSSRWYFIGFFVRAGCLLQLVSIYYFARTNLVT